MQKTLISVLFLMFLCLIGCSTPQEDKSDPAPEAEKGREDSGEQPSQTVINRNRRHLESEAILRQRVRAESCEKFAKELTKLPHVAGSKRNAELATYLVNTLRQFGFQVERHVYEVLLPYPVHVEVEMVSPVAFSASLREEPTELDLDTSNKAVLPFNAYSPDCDLTAPVIYVNYGRREDFERLTALGIDCRGKIALTRYGRIFRGSKAKIAAEFGAAAMILYSDPADDGFVKGDVYPHGPFRPSTAVERGSILDISTYPGDPGTPGIPSLPGEEQLTFGQMKSLPDLPTTCISQADAKPLLENMKGSTVPDGWQGGIPITYHLGDAATVRLRLHLEMDYSLRLIENITATLNGLRCPDEVILIGNHRDAWVHGASDPGSGTSVLLEAARVLADAKEAGQGLDRTVRFAFWDAEEFGIIGSTEYGEQFAKELSKECVAYINIDSAVSGPNLRLAGVPTLARFAQDVLSSIANEGKPGSLVDPLLNEKGEMRYGTLGSGSDYTVFLEHLGIDCIDIGSGGAHGVYHSSYDTYVFMKRFGDPGFKQHKVMARVLTTMVSRLASSEILPFDFKRLGADLLQTQKRMEARHKNLDLSEVGELANHVTDVGTKINQAMAKLGSMNLNLETRLLLNRRIYQASRKLLLKNGLSDRPWYKHALWAPHPDKGYGTEDLPTITDALLKKDKNKAQDGATELVSVLRAYLNEIDGLRQHLERLTEK